MGKTGKTLKRRRLAESLLAPPAATSGKSTSSLDVTFLGGLIAPEDLATTVRTLAILGQNTELLTNSRSELKGLRNVVYDFQRLSNELNGTGTSLTSRISTALAGGRWTDSLVLLAELKIRKLEPRCVFRVTLGIELCTDNEAREQTWRASALGKRLRRCVTTRWNVWRFASLGRARCYFANDYQSFHH